MKIEQCHNIEELRPLAESWASELSADEYGLDVDLDIVKADLESWLKGEGTVLVAREGDEIVALFAVFAVPSYLGKQKIALEKYWYAKRGSHYAGPRLYLEALAWAREHNCSHLITSGSKMASDRHDSICRFLERAGAQHFETSYIYRLGDDT
jgi:lysylphosphatidylglycerol synthetase-like protein (DUF2156 family)